MAKQTWTRRPHPKKKSKYVGVSFDAKRGKFRAKIHLPDRSYKHIGYFESEIEAARAYDKAALAIYGEKAVVNSA
jgi:hypothetical protein